ncbi:MAG TPA: CBS domain-containing protein [Candidatus Competibacteraceae bacterium]|nr:CBS domain-containing protein [Candidatus Competibacteraceae bacterium]MCP5134100.1 CBS domain-containing protein [Gammaproteobacteria bacterium]HPF59155.1 CBS domain-containing protein [Candidatus Competibacteraceae bacterium]HRY18557.1 CBS domain-containing protein [Candidatus Competibacteraceae bacterium]
MYEFLQYLVCDAMTPEPIAMSPKAKLREAEALFEVHDFNGVPVVDDQRHLLGILTKFDLLKAFIFDFHTLVPHYDEIMEQTIETVMTSHPVSVEPQLPLSRLLQKLVEMRAKSLPVVKEGRLVGMIAREDVLKALRRAAIQHETPAREEQ